MPFTLPPGVAVPSYARPEFAFEQTMTAASLGNTGGVIYTSQGNYYDIVLAVVATLTTDAALGKRVPVLSVAVQAGADVYDVPVVTAANPSEQHHLTWSYSTPTAYATSNGSSTLFQVMPIPTVALPPTSTVSIEMNNAGGVDVIAAISITVVHIPTGPIIEVPVEAPFPVPVTL